MQTVCCFPGLIWSFGASLAKLLFALFQDRQTLPWPISFFPRNRQIPVYNLPLCFCRASWNSNFCLCGTHYWDFIDTSTSYLFSFHHPRLFLSNLLRSSRLWNIFHPRIVCCSSKSWVDNSSKCPWSSRQLQMSIPTFRNCSWFDTLLSSQVLCKRRQDLSNI